MIDAAATACAHIVPRAFHSVEKSASAALPGTPRASAKLRAGKWRESLKPASHLYCVVIGALV